ncbi:non-muscle cofilin 1-like [Chaetodon trifascialis]|uniref:non-muscle cofilin 1-like n=1 Tax=Chaetodon trifascialis TaxID=109706 RepID=UPI003994473E
MASGVQVSDEVKDLITDIKLQRSEPMQHIRVAAFKIKDGFILKDEVVRQADLVGDDAFLAFKGLLDPKRCRYILYDCHFDTKESSNKKELVFVLWCPETGCVKDKMAFASSKDALKKCMTGIKHNLQMNEPSDCGDRHAFAGLVAKDITSLEGVNV